MSFQLVWPTKKYALSFLLDSEGNVKDKIWQHATDLNHNHNVSFEYVSCSGDKGSSNRLIHGDNLQCLQALVHEFQSKPEQERVKCIYIDPPYNTGKDIYNYHDDFEHSEWLSFMYPRLQLLHEVLRDDGFLCVQLDDAEHAYLDVLLAEIFGSDNKVGTIIWRRRQSQANLKKTVSTIHDYIVVFAKDIRKVDKRVLENLGRKLWTDTSKYGHNQLATKEIKKYFQDSTIFDTPKPELLLYHILQKLSGKGDLVLDCFAGSGTTLAVAHKMGRRWIGIEVMDSTFQLITERMEKVVSGKVQTEVDNLLRKKSRAGFDIYRMYSPKNEDLHSSNNSQYSNDSYYSNNSEYLNESQTGEYERVNLLHAQASRSAIRLEFSPTLKGHRITDTRILEYLRDIKSSIEDTDSDQYQLLVFSPPLELQDRMRSPLNSYNLFHLTKFLLSKTISLVKTTGFIVFHVYEPLYALMKIVLDELLGSKNHIATFIWKKTDTGNKIEDLDYEGDYFTTYFDYILLYARNMEEMTFYKLPPSKKLYSNPDNDPRGEWISHPLVASKKSTNKVFTYNFKDGREITKKWRYPPDSIQQLEKENRLHYTQPKNGIGTPRVKKFYADRLKEFLESGRQKRGTTPNTLLINPQKYGSLGPFLHALNNRGEEGGGEEFPTLIFSTPRLLGFLQDITLDLNDQVFQVF